MNKITTYGGVIPHSTNNSNSLILGDMDNRAFVEFALLVLYALQTPDERADRATKYQNGVGFNVQTGKFGPFYAEHVATMLVLKGKLLGECIDVAYKCRGNNRRPAGEESADCVRPHVNQVLRFVQTAGGLDKAKQAIGPKLLEWADKYASKYPEAIGVHLPRIA